MRMASRTFCDGWSQMAAYVATAPSHVSYGGPIVVAALFVHWMEKEGEREGVLLLPPWSCSCDGVELGGASKCWRA